MGSSHFADVQLCRLDLRRVRRLVVLLDQPLGGLNGLAQRGRHAPALEPGHDGDYDADGPQKPLDEPAAQRGGRDHEVRARRRLRLLTEPLIRVPNPERVHRNCGRFVPGIEGSPKIPLARHLPLPSPCET